MATEPEDIIEELKSHYEMLLNVEKKRKKTVKEKLSAEEKEVYDRLEPVPIGINEISGLTGVGYEKLTGILISLELKGLIKEAGKNLYIRL